MLVRVVSSVVLVSLVVMLTPPHPGVRAEEEGHVVALVPETGPFVAFKECYRELPTTDERPAHVTSAPEEATSWLVFPWGEKQATVAVSADTLWPDTDGDGDLAEEDGVPFQGSGGTKIELELAMPSDTVRATLKLTSYRKGRFRITNLTRMSGTVRMGEREMAVSLTDYLANGRYDDYRTTSTREYWLCDHIHLDRDGDGAFRRRIPPWGEDHSLARGFVLGETLYECEVLDRGEKLRFEPTDRPLVAVDVNTSDYVIRLVSDELGVCSLQSKGDANRLPVGRYQLDGYDYDVGAAKVSGLFWEEDGLRWLEVEEGCTLALAGDLRYELYAKLDDEGTLEFKTICFGPLGARVMLYPEGFRGNSVKPVLTVETDAREVLYRVTSSYC